MENHLEFVVPEHKKESFNKIKNLIENGKNVLVTGYAGNGKCSCVSEIIKDLNYGFVPMNIYNEHRYFNHDALQAYMDAAITGKDLLYIEEPQILDDGDMRVLTRFIKTTNKQIVLTWNTSYLRSAPKDLVERFEIISFD